MEIAGFLFNVGELDGCRFIESVFPEAIDEARLWAVASSYPMLWEERTPTVTVNDVSQLGELYPKAREVLRWVLTQNQLRAHIVATSWVCGPNAPAAEQLREVLVEVGRPTDSLFPTRGDAIAYLKGAIESFRRGGA